MIKRIFIIAMLLFTLPLSAADIILPALTGPVVDTAGLLTPEQVKQLTAKSLAFERAKGSQIAICIVPTVQPLPIEDFGIKLAEKWKIGRAKISDGIIIIVAKNDRKMRIEVGRGLEGIVTDLRAGRIITQVMAPEFRKGSFYKGIDSALDAIITFINGGDVPAVTAGQSGSSVTKNIVDTAEFTVGIWLLIASIVIFIILACMKKLVLSIVSTFLLFSGALYLMGTGTIGEVLGISGVSMAVFGAIAFFIKYGAGSGGGGYSGSSYSSYSSDSYDSSSSSSSSDSWSGGGGDFGGGGSSGDW